ncbi:hypothetical protein ZTR_10541 [Talaromyces verruculosus]|nr:hypothetical protein ZTR_10541 [Talaromyces verruculosus]
MELSNWFENAQGRDFPETKNVVRQRECVIGFEDSTFVRGYCKVHPDSQSPQITLSVSTKKNSPTAVIGLQSCTFEYEIESEQTTAEMITRLRNEQLQWFESIDKETVCLRILFEEVVYVGQLSLLDDTILENWDRLVNGLEYSTSVTIITPRYGYWLHFKLILDWLSMLQEKIHVNLQPRDTVPQPVPTAFWYYYEKLKENEQGETPNSRAIIPPYPWLYSATGSYNSLKPSEPFFIDHHERHVRMGKAMEVERQVQEKMVTDIFNFDNIHTAYIRDNDPEFFQFHIRLSNIDDKRPTMPELAEYTSTKLKMGEKFETVVDGLIIGVPTDDDLVIHVFKRKMQGYVAGPVFQIKIGIMPNLSPIDNQIKAIQQSSMPNLVFGDKPQNNGKGFSLLKTVLAHGFEVDPKHPDYFALDVATMSGLGQDTIQERLNYLERKFTLDDAQRQACRNSVRNIVAGINLVQGPPGTGKTHVAVAIIVTVACLGLKVLLTASSNKAVDNVACAVLRCLESDPILEAWCGVVTRARTPGQQMSIVRANTADPSVKKYVPTAKTDSEQILMRHELPYYVMSYANANSAVKSCGRFLDLQKQDDDQCLRSRDTQKTFRGAYQSICNEYVKTEVRVLATTLSNSASESLQGFQPDFVVCDNSGQCMEGDHMIAMTNETVKAVVLIGDQKQLPPTLISENAESPEVNYIRRSLMQRLHEAGYPCTMLNMNYRCHPHILDFFNRMAYKSLLKAADANSLPSRAGNVWESFVNEYFRQPNLVGKHRVMIDCDGIAESPAGSTSFVNYGQIDVALTLLQKLYAHVTAEGETIRPSDIMLISPYKEHRSSVQKIAAERNVDYNENLTIDASQGQESNIVIYMLVKPTKQANIVGFVAGLARLNVSLSRAKKVLVIVGNLSIWNAAKRKELKRTTSLAWLMELFNDAEAKKDVVKWSEQPYTSATSLAPPAPAVTSRMNPVVRSLEQLEIQSASKPKDSSRPTRRRRSSDASDTELVTGGSSKVPKRQRLESSVSLTPDDFITRVRESLQPSEKFEENLNMVDWFNWGREKGFI